MKARIVNGQWAKNHQEEWLLKNSELHIGGQKVSEWTLTDVLPTEEEQKYVNLMFDFNTQTYFEGASEEEIQQREIAIFNTYNERINNAYTLLYKSALSRVTNKKGDLEYLQILKEEYEQKYKIACQVLNDEQVTNIYMLNQIDTEKEFEDFEGEKLNVALTLLGLTSLNDRLKDFCQIIKFRFEYANGAFEQFKNKVTFMRTRLITDLELKHYDVIEQRLEVVDYVLNNTLNESEIMQQYQNFILCG